MITVDISDTLKDLQDFVPKIQKKILTAAVRSAAVPMRRAARDEVPKKTQALERSFIIKTRRYPDKCVAIIGPSSDYMVDGKRPARYSHLVEFGTHPHLIGRKQHPGAKPTHFLQTAYDRSKQEALDILARRIAEGIENECKKSK